jgi:FixJ family two-component response regulator
MVVVDDDESVRESLPDLLRELGFEAETFASPEEFLRSSAVERADCLLLDIAMPGMSGSDLQAELARTKRTIPIVFITAQADENMRARVLSAGAVDCLLKPFTEGALIRAIRIALETSRK